MAGIPEIIMQGASMVNQAVQHQQQMKIETERFKMQKQQWEDSLKWRQQEMEARVATAQEENNLKEFKLQLAQAQLTKARAETEEIALRDLQRQAQYRPDVTAQDEKQLASVQQFGNLSNDQLMAQMRSAQGALTRLIGESGGSPFKDESTKRAEQDLRDQVAAMAQEQTWRNQAFLQIAGPNVGASQLDEQTRMAAEGQRVGAGGVPSAGPGSASPYKNASTADMRAALGTGAESILNELLANPQAGEASLRQSLSTLKRVANDSGIDPADILNQFQTTFFQRVNERAPGQAKTYEALYRQIVENL